VAEGKYLRFISVFTLATLAVLAKDDGKSTGAAPADGAAGGKTAAGTVPVTVPPVLRKTEPSDDMFVLLPGPPPATKVLLAPAAPAPKPLTAPAPKAPGGKAVESAERHEPPPPELTDPGRPILHRAPRPVYPADFELDSGLFCQKQIGQWKEAAALALLGAPSGDRPAFDDNQSINGRIYAFSDPTNRYKQLELDFDSETGVLRTVFVYPWKMTWQDCRRLWGGNVTAAEANQGRKFYSYLNRRLDVLVDAAGKVISIGLY
jgi:hypothetical protein